jgi:hypothetical protein
MRHAADLRVYLLARSGALSATGYLREFSLSGGLVQSDLPAGDLSSICIRFPRAYKLPRLTGHVIRRSGRGLAIEWTEYATNLVRKLTADTAKFRSPLLLADRK